MTRKKGKSVSFDAMVKFFMQHYGIPTRTDIEKLIDRLDRLEKLIKASGVTVKNRRAVSEGKTGRGKARNKSATTATHQVLAAIKKMKNGAGLKEIKTKTGFEEKKIRNILYQLHKLEKIKRKSRGTYVAV